MRAKQNQVLRLAEHHVVRSRTTGYVHEGQANPALQHGPIGLPEAPYLPVFYSQGLEQRGGKPGELRTGSNEDRVQHAPRARAEWILDLDVDAKGSHVVRHSNSSLPGHGTQIN